MENNYEEARAAGNARPPGAPQRSISDDSAVRACHSWLD